MARLRPFHVAVRVAAAIVLVAAVFAVYRVATQRPVTVVSPMTQPTMPEQVAVQNNHDSGGATVSPKEAVPGPSVAVKGTDSTPAPQPLPVANESVAMASPFGISGTIDFVGAPAAPKSIDTSANEECRLRHPQGLVDDSLLVSNGKLANVVVSIEPTKGQNLIEMASSAAYEERPPLLLDQRDCKFQPRVLAGMVGQELIVSNSDPFLHNVHSKSDANPKFNIGQPTVEFGRRLDPLAAPERFEIKCDIHPWMTASMSVFAHPYFAVSKADGSFTIPTAGLEDGVYTLLAWHETLGTRRALIEIRNGHATAMTEIKFSEGHAAATPAAHTLVACPNCLD